MGSGSSIAVDLVGAAKGVVRKTVVWGQILMGLELGITPELELQKLGTHRLALSQRCKARSGRMSPWAAVWTWAGKGAARSRAASALEGPLGRTKQLAVKFRVWCKYLFLDPSSGSRCLVNTYGMNE